MPTSPGDKPQRTRGSTSRRPTSGGAGVSRRPRPRSLTTPTSPLHTTRTASLSSRSSHGSSITTARLLDVGAQRRARHGATRGAPCVRHVNHTDGDTSFVVPPLQRTSSSGGGTLPSPVTPGSLSPYEIPSPFPTEQSRRPKSAASGAGGRRRPGSGRPPTASSRASARSAPRLAATMGAFPPASASAAVLHMRMQADLALQAATARRANSAEAGGSVPTSPVVHQEDGGTEKYGDGLFATPLNTHTGGGREVDLPVQPSFVSVDSADWQSGGVAPSRSFELGIGLPQGSLSFVKPSESPAVPAPAVEILPASATTSASVSDADEDAPPIHLAEDIPPAPVDLPPATPRRGLLPPMDAASLLALSPFAPATPSASEVKDEEQPDGAAWSPPHGEARLRKQLHQADADKRQLQVELDILSQSLRHERSHRNVLIGEATTEASNNAIRYELTAKKLAAASAELEASRVHQEAQAKQLAALRLDLKSSQRKVDLLTKRLEDRAEEAGRWELTRDALLAKAQGLPHAWQEVEVARAQEKRAASLAEAAVRRKTEAEEEASTHKDSLSKALVEVQEAQGDLLAQRAREATLQSALNAATARADAAVAEAATLQAAVCSKEDAVAELQNQLAATNRALRDSKAQVVAAVRDQKRTEATQVEQEAEMMAAGIATAAQASEAAQAAKSFERKTNALQAQVFILEEAKKGLEARNEALTVTVGRLEDAARAAASSHKDALGLAEDRLRDVTAKLAAAEADAAAAHSAADAKQATLSDLERRHTALVADAAALRLKAASATASAQRARGAASAARDTEDRLAGAVEELDRLRMELGSVEQHRTQAVSEAQDAKQRAFESLSDALDSKRLADAATSSKQTLEDALGRRLLEEQVCTAALRVQLDHALATCEDASETLRCRIAKQAALDDANKLLAAREGVAVRRCLRLTSELAALDADRRKAVHQCSEVGFELVQVESRMRDAQAAAAAAKSAHDHEVAELRARLTAATAEIQGLRSEVGRRAA